VPEVLEASSPVPPAAAAEDEAGTAAVAAGTTGSASAATGTAAGIAGTPKMHLVGLSFHQNLHKLLNVSSKFAIRSSGFLVLMTTSST
jgi:hypothetical protein